MKKHNKDSLIKIIQDFHLSNNRVPVSSELSVRIGTFRRYFGTYFKAIQAAGLSPPVQRKIPSSKKCEFCLDSFKPKNFDQRFCSRSCAAKFNNQLEHHKHCLQCNARLKNHKRIFCSHKCRTSYIHENETIPKIKSNIINDRAVLKRYLIRLNGYKCSECGLSEWNNQRLPLELDHIDGNALNNYPFNIRLLCPNCHSITPTWKSKNKGKGRQSLGIQNK